MDNQEVSLMYNISEILSQDITTGKLIEGVLLSLQEFTQVTELKVYIYDEVTSTLRNCQENWAIIEDKNDIYTIFNDIQNNDFVINSKAYKLPSTIGDITFKINTLFVPLIKSNNIFGLTYFNFKDGTSVDTKFLLLMKVFASQISLKIQNIMLSEQTKINLDFQDAMKNIAKIIETQYELNYIVPLIGEMLDRFISDHLIYVFLKRDTKFNLIWPKACNDARIYEILAQLTSDNYILTQDNKLGAFPLISENGDITGCIVARSMLDTLSKRDISYLEQLTRQSSITINRANTYAKVLQYATLDALTNLNNRHQFEVRLKQEIATTKRQNTPLCAMMIDIDFFKKVNDTYGHASGDIVLRTVASIIKDTFRESDIPSRYGGEEFAILLPYTRLDEAKIVGERLRKAVEEKKICLEKQEISVTISMGIAEYDKIESGEKLFERADKALYNAKENGRNQVKTV